MVRNAGKGMACERDLWQERSGMRSRMNHPGRRCCDGFVPWLTSVPVSQGMGLSKRVEMPLLCQPRASGADVRLCAFCFFLCFYPEGTFRDRQD